MNLIWGTSRGFPGAWPVRPFKEYARRHMLPAAYYHNAYPGASVRDIESALRVADRFDEFQRTYPRNDPAEFRRAYRGFIDSVEGHLGSSDVRVHPETIEHAFR